jgi:hypothetical protein
MINETELWPSAIARPCLSSAITPERARGAACLVDVSDLRGQPNAPQASARSDGPSIVIARRRDTERAASMLNVDALPGQSLDHRVEAYGARSWSRKISLIFRATASSVSNCLIRRLAADSSIACSVVRPATSPAVDPLLAQPVVDRRLGHPQRRGELPDASAGPGRLNDLTANLGCIAAGLVSSDCRRTPEPRCRGNGGQKGLRETQPGSVREHRVSVGDRDVGWCLHPKGCYRGGVRTATISGVIAQAVRSKGVPV